MNTINQKAKKALLYSFMTFTLLSCNNNNDEAIIETKESEGSIQKGRLGNQEITYLKKDGKNFFEGDIVLSDQQLNRNFQKGAGVLPTARWPQGRIYYTIASNMGSINVNKINQAINEYNTRTNNVRWIPRTNQSNYVQFIFGSQNGADGWANIGFQGGQQTVSLDQNVSVGTVIHEMGHTVGLYHEHTRSDRDQYVRILWNNIISNQRHNFNIYNSGVDIGPFNINSVMMYWPNSYTANGQPTIVRADGSNFTYTRNGFTQSDINVINFMY